MSEKRSRQDREIAELKNKLNQLEQIVDGVRAGDAEIQPYQPRLLSFSPDDDSGESDGPQHQTIFSMRAGPTPGPEEIERLEKIQKGLGVRLMDDIHKASDCQLQESEHRREMEKDDQGFAHRYFRKGQNISIGGMVIGALIAAAILCLAFLMVWKGAYSEAAWLVGVGMATAVSPFLVDKVKESKKTKKEKDKPTSTDLSRRE